MSAPAFNPAPMCEEEVLDPRWLGWALSQGRAPVEVREVRVAERLVHTWTKLRLELSYDGAPGGLTSSICIKAALGENARQFGASATEAKFYRDCAPRLSLRVPACLYIGIDEETGHGLFIMEDLIPQGALFGSALSHCSLEAARDAISQLAALHVEAGKLWTPETLPMARPFLDIIAATPIIPNDLLAELLAGPRCDPLPGNLRSADRLHAGIVALSARFSDRPRSLLHGDAHAGNLYRQDGRTGILDWQVLQWGCWALDVAYHIAAVLAPEDRRLHEQALVKHYRDSVRSLGGSVPGADQAWADYRAALVYAFYLWGVTRRVAPDITNEFTRRLGLAVYEHDSFELLGV